MSLSAVADPEIFYFFWGGGGRLTILGNTHNPRVTAWSMPMEYGACALSIGPMMRLCYIGIRRPEFSPGDPPLNQ